MPLAAGARVKSSLEHDVERRYHNVFVGIFSIGGFSKANTLVNAAEQLLDRRGGIVRCTEN